ncbi:MAG: HAMP domain-containing histidine kinase [Lachnospiraceae bacterium]|nr:HAMP domain-containing histidine kinase [Lachnospiraceae bacterium]
MNRFKTFVCFIIIIEIALVGLCNGLYIYRASSGAERMDRVEAKRVVLEIEERQLTDEAIAQMDLSEYETIVQVREFVAGEVCNNDYVVDEINDKLYRIEYKHSQSFCGLIYMDCALLGMVLVTVVILLYVYQKVLKPFHAMSNLSCELAKGNLSVPIKEEKSKFFGRFLWGLDMLREQLEDNKQKELEFQKDRKTLILSLSHDIKTPLASIELYSKALSDHLYDTEEKKEEALQGIARNVKEIKQYVDEIVKASREDFLNLEVVEGEVYLTEIIKAIQIYYHDKLSVVHTEFYVEDVSECLVKGDTNRLIEVLQNVIENAIKYGDGKAIRISFEDEEDCKLIHIKNSGRGPEEAELPNLFDSFYRGSNSHGVNGNGLGLYICKSLMHKMDGAIYAENQAESFVVTVVVRKA